MLTLIAAAVTITVSVSISFLLVSVYNLYKSYKDNPGATSMSVKDRLALLPDDVVMVLKTFPDELRPDMLREMIAFIGRAEYLEMVLSVALVLYEARKVVLCRLRSGEFAGQWGFPAGYVSAKNKEEYAEPRLKAEYEIKKYLDVDSADLSYLGCLTEDSPLRILYSNPAQPEVKVYQYAIAIAEISAPDCRIVAFDEIEDLDVVVPLVFDVLEHYEKFVFTDSFRKRIGAAKTERSKVVLSLVGRTLDNNNEGKDRLNPTKE